MSCPTREEAASVMQRNNLHGIIVIGVEGSDLHLQVAAQNSRLQDVLDKVGTETCKALIMSMATNQSSGGIVLPGSGHNGINPRI